MKITRLLPKKLAIYWQELVIDRMETELEYYRQKVRILEYLLEEGNEELRRLKGWRSYD
jgi:hypothetical protein